jgi:zinc protease
VFRFDSAEKIAFEKAVFDFFGYPENYLNTFRDKIAAVTPADVLEAAKKLVKLDQMQIVIVGPANQLGDLARFGPVVTIHDVEAFR